MRRSSAIKSRAKSRTSASHTRCEYAVGLSVSSPSAATSSAASSPSFCWRFASAGSAGGVGDGAGGRGGGGSAEGAGGGTGKCGGGGGSDGVVRGGGSSAVMDGVEYLRIALAEAVGGVALAVDSIVLTCCKSVFTAFHTTSQVLLAYVRTSVRTSRPPAVAEVVGTLNTSMTLPVLASSRHTYSASCNSSGFFAYVSIQPSSTCAFISPIVNASAVRTQISGRHPSWMFPTAKVRVSPAVTIASRADAEARYALTTLRSTSLYSLRMPLSNVVVQRWETTPYVLQSMLRFHVR